MQFLTIVPEIVLSVLIESFEFNVTDKKIEWFKYHIMAPHVEGDPFIHFSLPLRVSYAPEVVL